MPLKVYFMIKPKLEVRNTGNVEKEIQVPISQFLGQQLLIFESWISIFYCFLWIWRFIYLFLLNCKCGGVMLTVVPCVKKLLSLHDHWYFFNEWEAIYFVLPFTFHLAQHSVIISYSFYYFSIWDIVSWWVTLEWKGEATFLKSH